MDILVNFDRPLLADCCPSRAGDFDQKRTVSLGLIICEDLPAFHQGSWSRNHDLHPVIDRHLGK